MERRSRNDEGEYQKHSSGASAPRRNVRGVRRTNARNARRRNVKMEPWSRSNRESPLEQCPTASPPLLAASVELLERAAWMCSTGIYDSRTDNRRGR